MLSKFPIIESNWPAIYIFAILISFHKMGFFNIDQIAFADILIFFGKC